VNTAGLILAAGASRRMGHPKALLDYRGETFLDRLIGAFAAVCSPVIVVLGGEAERIRTGIVRTAEACLVVNPDPSRGQITSLQTGLRAVPEEAEAVLYTLVDHPAVSCETVTDLTSGSPPLLRIPRWQGRRGHPILIGRQLIGEILSLPETATARDLVHRYVAATEYVDVDDPGILADIDNVEDYCRLIGGRA